jgi:hypothetical protein
MTNAAEFHAAVARVEHDHAARWQIEHDETTWPRRWTATATERTGPRQVVTADGIVGLADKLRKAECSNAVTA